MYIYKITNSVNGKVYIGQTINPIEKRFQRHLQDSTKLDTHFARAIRKYGKEAFSIECIDTATSQEELNLKEHDWIQRYNSIEEGYNETDSILKSGGNTYLSKTPEEMEAIKDKIRQTKLGGKNPMAKGIKCKNQQTNEELFFNSMAEARDYFGEMNHQFVSRRCLGTIKSLYKGLWAFAYQDQEYGVFTEGIKRKHSRTVIATNLQTNESMQYPSYAACERGTGISAKQIQKKISESSTKEIEYKGYNIKLVE